MDAATHKRLAYGQSCAKAGSEGVEIKTTRKAGGAVDTHGARNQWMCVFVYAVDNKTEPARQRAPMSFTEVYLGGTLRRTTSAEMLVVNSERERLRCTATASRSSGKTGSTARANSFPHF